MFASQVAFVVCIIVIDHFLHVTHSHVNAQISQQLQLMISGDGSNFIKSLYSNSRRHNDLLLA